MEILLAAVGSAAFFSFIQFLISRHDKKQEQDDSLTKEVSELKDAMRRMEKDECRTQMLVLMSDYPEETAELMKLAEHYFSVLHANWYMSSIFNKWLIKNKIEKPIWFDDEE